MAKITNDHDDVINVECGGFGGDNVLGTVEEASTGGGLVPAADAVVAATNLTNGATGTAKTNRNGAFDIDIDAACNDLIHISATWKDEGGRRHTVRGMFRCPPCEDGDEQTAARAPSQRREQIARLEALAGDLSAAEMTQRDLRDALQQQIFDRVLGDLNALGKASREVQQAETDEMLEVETTLLIENFRRLRRAGGVPPADQLWELLQQMVLVLAKLNPKVFYLQP